MGRKKGNVLGFVNALMDVYCCKSFGGSDGVIFYMVNIFPFPSPCFLLCFSPPVIQSTLVFTVFSSELIAPKKALSELA